MTSNDVKHEWTSTIEGFESMSAADRVAQGSTFKSSLDAVEPWTDSSWGLFGPSYATYQALQERLAAARSSAMIELGRSAGGAVSQQAAQTGKFEIAQNFVTDTGGEFGAGAAALANRGAGVVKDLGGAVEDAAKSTKAVAILVPLLVLGVLLVALYRRAA